MTGTIEQIINNKSPSIYVYVNDNSKQILIDKYCIENNIILNDTFKDEINERKKFISLIKLLKPGDKVISYSLSNLCKCSDDISYFDKNNISLIILDIRLEETQNKMFFAAISAVSKFERECIAARG
jgi:DNA invertase Pin-like site-specific DNA recombinase